MTRSTRGVGSSERWLRARVVSLGALFLGLLGLLLVRAIKLQVTERERLSELARDQYVREYQVPARRGEITDRRGAPLAQSVEVESIFVDPERAGDPTEVVKRLSTALRLDARELASRVSRGRRFAWVKRQASPVEVTAVRALGLPGVGFLKEPRRFYPQRELLAHVLGIVGADGKGLDGLELAFDDELSGESAVMPALRDARGRSLMTHAMDSTVPLSQGATITLTVDLHLQHLAEKALAKAVVDAQAVAGLVIVLDPRTGEVLAIANHPRFNPNAPGAAHAMRNRAVTDLYEPGSTMKALTIASAIEAGVIGPEDTLFCENGAWEVGRSTVHDTHPHGALSVAQVLKVSSNICAGKIAQKLGRERWSEYVARFGFGARAGVGLPGEGKGSVPFPKAEVALVTQSFGQGLSATALQVAAAYGALANRGVLMRPYLVSKVVDADGLVLLENRPTPVRQVVSARTAARVVKMLEEVVEPGGTATRARLAEYRVSGKTGTSQKPDPLAGGYSEKRVASFVGMVPAEAPSLVVLVAVDEPKVDVYGGVVAAPAFKDIAGPALAYLSIPPSLPVPTVIGARQVEAEPEGAVGRPSAALVAAFSRVDPPQAITAGGKGNVVVPNVAGEFAQAAVRRLVAVALEPRLEGTGAVVAQEPLAGTLVEKGTKVKLELASGLPH